jgi:hypothetical protein
MLTKSVEYGEGGYRAVVYDDQAELIGHWFGTRAECEAVKPSRVTLYPIRRDSGVDSFDLACERRHD